MDSGNFFLVLLLLSMALLLPFLIFLMRNLRGILPYLYVTARIRAKEARLLKPETVDEMISTGSVAEIASILENTEYALAGQGLVLDSAESIESVLTRQTADVYCEVAGMLPPRVEKVFAFLRRQWDARNIKTILRGVRHGLPADDIIAGLVPFGEMDREALKKMAEAPSVEDVLAMFEGTQYGHLAAESASYEQQKSLLTLEAHVDRQLFEQMWNVVTSDGELQDVRPGFAARIDALNLKVLFRAKRDRLLLSDIEAHLIAGGALPVSVRQVFDEVDDVEALIAELEPTTFYKPLMDVMPEYEKTKSLLPLERALDEQALSVGRMTSIKKPYGVAPVLGYLSLKDTEIRNIRAVARGKEAGLASETIRQWVVRV